MTADRKELARLAAEARERTRQAWQQAVDARERVEEIEKRMIASGVLRHQRGEPDRQPASDAPADQDA